jgi:hypothetical protein
MITHPLGRAHHASRLGGEHANGRKLSVAKDESVNTWTISGAWSCSAPKFASSARRSSATPLARAIHLKDISEAS